MDVAPRCTTHFQAKRFFASTFFIVFPKVLFHLRSVRSHNIPIFYLMLIFFPFLSILDFQAVSMNFFRSDPNFKIASSLHLGKVKSFKGRPGRRFFQIQRFQSQRSLKYHPLSPWVKTLLKVNIVSKFLLLVQYLYLSVSV